MFELIIKSIRNNVSKSVIDFGLSSIFVWFAFEPLTFEVIKFFIKFISNNVSKFVIEFGLSSIWCIER